MKRQPLRLALMEGERILAAAERHDVEVSESSWRELAKGGKDRKH